MFCSVGGDDTAICCSSWLPCSCTLCDTCCCSLCIALCTSRVRVLFIKTVCFSACYLVYIHLRNNSNLFAHFTTRVLKQFQFLHKLIITYSTSKCLWKKSDSEIYIHVLSFMLLFMFEVEDSLHNLLLIIWQNLQWASLCYLLLKTHLYHNFLAKSHCVKKVSTPSFAVVSNKVLQMTATRHWVRIWGWNYSVTVWKV